MERFLSHGHNLLASTEAGGATSFGSYQFLPQKLPIYMRGRLAVSIAVQGVRPDGGQDHAAVLTACRASHGRSQPASMMIMRPPQLGHGCEIFSAPSSRAACLAATSATARAIRRRV